MRVALTGGIGAGKSTVARMLADHGALVIDADAIAREVVAPGLPALADIADAFGQPVIRPDGALDRPALAARVFGDPEALARLNAITHPRIAARTAEILASTSPEAIVVYDMPLLVEQGAEAIAGWDAVVVVDAPDDLRIRRLVARGVAEDDARRRMAAQAAREERLAIADFVLRNAEGEAELQAQVDSLWEALMARGT